MNDFEEECVFYPGAVTCLDGIPETDDFVAVLMENEVVLHPGSPALPRFREFQMVAAGQTFWAIGRLNERRCCAVRVPAGFPLPADLQRQDLRSARLTLAPAFDIALCRARTLSFWKKNHLHCSVCGAEAVLAEDECAILCPVCGSRTYPQLAPAVIVAVNDPDGRLLLAHNSKFKPGLFGLVAGFVEAGETLEEAVRREVLEETGVTVTRLEYVASQSWPYPNSLMIGFRAFTPDRTVRPDGTEITEAGFYAREEIPEIPAPGSIARALIDAWKTGAECAAHTR